MSYGEELFQKHIDFVSKGDIDGLMANNYHDDVEMVTFEFILKGKEAIAKYMKEDAPKITGQILGMSLDYFTATDDLILFKASVKTEKFGIIKSDDALYLKDGKVFRHIALTIPPEATKEWALKVI
jgi:hypothetical protein